MISKPILGAVVLCIVTALVVFAPNTSPSSKIKIEPSAENPSAARALEIMKTSDVLTGEIPYEMLWEANRLALNSREMVTNGLLQSASTPFIERGPTDVGGRTRAIMWDPNVPGKVWAAGVGGGIWYVNDIYVDQAWANVSDIWTNLSVSAIAFDPSNTQNFYVGTGERYSGDAIRGPGIFKSSDGGATWPISPLPSTTGDEFRTVQDIVVTDQGSVIAATGTFHGIHRSVDGGTTWTQLLDNETISDLKILVNGTILAGANFSGKVYRSVDDGVSWTTVIDDPAQRRAETCAGVSNPNTVYAVFQSSANSQVSRVARSTDAGLTWTDQGAPSSTAGQAWYDLVCFVNPLNADQVYMGVARMYRSNDAGLTWSSGGNWNSQHVDHHAMAAGPTNGGAVPLVFGNDGGVYFSADAFAAQPTVSTREIGYNTTQYYAGALHPDAGSNILLGGTQDNGTQRLTNPGASNSTHVSGGDGAFSHIDQTNPNIAFASYQFINIRRSTNGGQSFSTIHSGGNSLFINPSEYNSNTNVLFANDGTGMWRCPDMENSASCSFVDITNNPGHKFAMTVSPYSPANNSNLFIGGSGGYIGRIDNADSGTPLTMINLDPNNILPSGTINSIDIGASENQIMATFSSYNTSGGQIWETLDGGNSWTAISGDLPAIPVRWGLYNPENYNEIMAATEAGLWSTSNASSLVPSWVIEPSVPITRIDMLAYRASDATVLASTHGRGFWAGAFEAPLPVELSDMQWRLEDQEILLSWTTLSESNNAGFEVQELEGETWNDRGFVKGVGNSDLENKYSFRLGFEYGGSRIFRLKQLDFDGAVNYSDMLEVDLSSQEIFSLGSAFPNPFSESARFSLTLSERQEVSIELYDIQGVRVRTLFSGELASGVRHNFAIDSQGLSKGTYLYRVLSPKFEESRKVVLN